ncbi:MAG TPA: DUF4160 domain-containing protein [Geminicoccaceae bacterium]|jgi:hypothetical protein|nr:DUF4160 domain-containing protein [Geminicoccaceae bacterium]
MRASRLATGETDDLFEMANLSPALTGLPMIVWISERGHARHDARVKVSLVHGRRARPDRTASVSVRPTVEIVAGRRLDRQDMDLVRKWIELNREVIIAYWNGDLLTDEAIARLEPIVSRSDEVPDQ